MDLYFGGGHYGICFGEVGNPVYQLATDSAQMPRSSRLLGHVIARSNKNPIDMNCFKCHPLQII